MQLHYGLLGCELNFVSRLLMNWELSTHTNIYIGELSNPSADFYFHIVQLSAKFFKKIRFALFRDTEIVKLLSLENKKTALFCFAIIFTPDTICTHL